MKVGVTLDELKKEVLAQQKAKQDFVAPISKIVADLNGDTMVVNVGNKSFDIAETAHMQLAQFLNIPASYYRRMASEAPDLWSMSVNSWMNLAARQSNSKRLVRTLSGTMRAFLSDRYRPLEHIDLLAAALPSLEKLNLRILSSQITETRLYLKATTAEGWEKVQIARAKKGEHARFEWYSPAICLSNSEVGHGSLSVEVGMFTEGCTNLAWMPEKSLRKYHLGKRLSDLSDEVYAVMTDETKRLTDQALWMQFRDVLSNALNKDEFQTLFEQVIEGKKDTLPPEGVVESVTFASKKLLLDEEEGKQVLGHLISSGELSRYGLFQAVTRTAENSPNYDRATDLERLGGRILEWTNSEWQQVAQAA